MNSDPAIDTVNQKPKDTWLKKLLRYGIPLVVTVGLCWTLFRNQDIGSMIDTIREKCSWQWIWFALGLSVLSHVIRAMRWRIQLQAIGIRIGLYPVVLSIFGCYAVNLVFPRLGELWRTGYIAQRQDAPFDKVFGSMVADRLADTVTVATLTLITFILAGQQLTAYLIQNRESYLALQDLITSPWLWIGAVVIVAAVWLILTRCRNNRVVKAIVNFVKGLWNGFAVVATMPGRLRWFILTIALWGCYFTQLYLAFFAFPETAQMIGQQGITAALVCFVFTSLSMGVPSNGGIGPWHWALIFGISLFSSGIPGLTDTLAASFANLVMGTQTILLIVLGLFTFISIAIGRRNKSKKNNQNA